VAVDRLNDIPLVEADGAMVDALQALRPLEG
jgi:hypothetical protein